VPESSPHFREISVGEKYIGECKGKRISKGWEKIWHRPKTCAQKDV